MKLQFKNLFGILRISNNNGKMRIKFDGMSSSVGDIEKNEFDGTKIYLTVGVATVPFELDGPQSPSNPNSPGNQPELVNIACN